METDHDVEVTAVSDEINHLMSLFAKQRITQEELTIALEKTKKKAGMQKMTTFGNFIRYGPYKSKDIFAFVRLLILLEDHKLLKQMHLVEEAERFEKQHGGGRYEDVLMSTPGSPLDGDGDLAMDMTNKSKKCNKIEKYRKAAMSQVRILLLVTLS